MQSNAEYHKIFNVLINNRVHAFNRETVKLDNYPKEILLLKRKYICTLTFLKRQKIIMKVHK